MIEVWLAAAILAAAVAFYLAHALLQKNPALESPRPVEKRVALGIVLLIPLVGLGVYSALGNPDLADQPFATRPDRAVKEVFDNTREKMLALGQKLQEKGGSEAEWQRFGQFATALRDPEQAEIAWRHLVTQQPDNPDYLVFLIQSLMVKNNGQLTPEIRKLLDKLLEIAPNHPVAVEILRQRKAMIAR